MEDMITLNSVDGKELFFKQRDSDTILVSLNKKYPIAGSIKETGCLKHTFDTILITDYDERKGFKELNYHEIITSGNIWHACCLDCDTDEYYSLISKEKSYLEMFGKYKNNLENKIWVSTYFKVLEDRFYESDTTPASFKFKLTLKSYLDLKEYIKKVMKTDEDV